MARKSLAREHRARSSRDHVPVIATKIYFTSYNIQNQLASHIDHKRLRGFALKLCLLRGGQLYPCGNFVMGGYAACISEMFKLLHPYHTSTHHTTFSSSFQMLSKTQLDMDPVVLSADYFDFFERLGSEHMCSGSRRRRNKLRSRLLQ